MFCKNCVHHNVCLTFSGGIVREVIMGNKADKQCGLFKNKEDFVEVVRCKDCKHKVLTESNRVMCSRNAQKMSCFAEWYGLTATNDNNYCSYGERKEEL